MVALYRVPLGTTARNFFAEEAEQNYKYDEALLVLPSRLLVNHARQESRTQAVNFEYLPNKIVSLNRHLLALPKDSKLEMISRRTQELLVADLLRQLDKLQGLHYFTGAGREGRFCESGDGPVRTAFPQRLNAGRDNHRTDGMGGTQPSLCNEGS